MRMRSSMLVVRRRCLVCDTEQIHDEPEETDPIGVPCETCQAPTERVEIVKRHLATNPHAAALGHLGGIKGSPARASALSPERRREIAAKAARARWGRKR